MMKWRRFVRWITGPLRVRRLSRLRLERLRRDLPGLMRQARRAMEECREEMHRARPGLERWQLKVEWMGWQDTLWRLRRLAIGNGVTLR